MNFTETLYKQILHLIENEDLRLILSKNSKKTFNSNFSQEAIFGALSKFLVNE